MQCYLMIPEGNRNTTESESMKKKTQEAVGQNMYVCRYNEVYERVNGYLKHSLETVSLSVK